MTQPANAVSNSATSPFEPMLIVLVRKLVLLILLMIVSALGLVTLLRHIHFHSLVLANILSDALMALIAGFSARWILRNQTGFLRFVSILAFLIGGLELLGWFTGWQIGFRPLRMGLSSVDWYSLGQLFLGSGIGLLALVAWTKPTPAVVDPAPAPKPIKRPLQPRQQRNKRHRRPAQSRSIPEPQAVTAQPVEPKHRRITRRKPHLQLSAQEEHRCPYCLELIHPEDPLGTVECKICHTLHHADCWAITGACQVPHYTA
jgi:hypothetical protein